MRLVSNLGLMMITLYLCAAILSLTCMSHFPFPPSLNHATSDDHAAPQYRRGLWKNVFQTEEAKGLFTPLTELDCVYHMDLTLDDIISRVYTKSYISVLGDEEKTRIKPLLRDILVNNVPEFINHKGNPPKEVTASYQHVTDWVIAYKK